MQLTIKTNHHLIENKIRIVTQAITMIQHQPLVGWRVVIPEGERTPFTPPPGPSSSLVLRARSWSAVTRAVAANWALAWSNVFARPCRGRRKLFESLKKKRKKSEQFASRQPEANVGYSRAYCLQWRCCWLAVAAGSAPAALSASGPAAPDAAGTVRLWELRETSVCYKPGNRFAPSYKRLKYCIQEDKLISIKY